MHRYKIYFEKPSLKKIEILVSEVQCSDPTSVKDGFIEVSNFKGRYVYGSLATYHCNPGFILWGNASRLCSDDGEWTGMNIYFNHGWWIEEGFTFNKTQTGVRPQCNPITCGMPLEYNNAKYTLVNGSTSWKSMSSYTCKPGFKIMSSYGNQFCVQYPLTLIMVNHVYTFWPML